MLDPTNEWYRKTVELLEAAGKRAPGRYYLGVPDLNGPGEILSRLRGPEKLAVDLIENPRRVHEALRKLNRTWLECFHNLMDVIHRYVDGYIYWMGIWSDRPSTDLQCDFSIMISPEMFDEFFLPYLEEQTEWVERTIYHLDGPGAARHLDSLLSLPRLTGIQWVPGAGAPPMSEWMDLLRRVQQAGKLLFITCQDWEVEPILKGLSPEGLLVDVRTTTVQKGREILELARRLT